MTFLLAIVWMPIGAVLYTLTLSVLWRWFLVPLDFPVLSLPHLYGLSLIVMLLTQSLPPPDDRDPLGLLIVGAVSTVVRLSLALAAGWVALQLMGGAV